ncbi:MAG TPA: hypothetical protein VNF51_01590 [Candidatus Paceibacterota bacterium]|nr:hypothetical protein [Candidatus Paceibacterota bacterium]
MEPQSQSTPTSKQIILKALIFVVGIIIGALASFYLYSSSSYQAGFNAAKTLVENSSLGNVSSTTDVHMLLGTVTAVNGDSIRFHIRSVNPFYDSSLADRTVVVNASTTVTRITPEDPKVYQAELDSLMKTTHTATTSTANLLLTVAAVTSAKASDIKIGDVISVFSTENVKVLEEFTGYSIQILSQSAFPMSAQ